MHHVLAQLTLWGPETQLPYTHRSLESKQPPAARTIHSQQGLWTEKGMVSKQHEPRRRKELAGEEWLRAWEVGILQVGNWQCPRAQWEWIGSREDGWRESLGSRLGRRARKDLHSCWPVNGSDAPPDSFSDCRPIHMQIFRD